MEEEKGRAGGRLGRGRGGRRKRERREREVARALLSLSDGASREERIEPEALAARESEGEGEIEGSVRLSGSLGLDGWAAGGLGQMGQRGCL